MTKKHRQQQRKVQLQKHRRGNFDWLFLVFVLGIVLFGLLMIFDASVFDSYSQFGDKFRFVRLQAIRGVIGFGLMLMAMLMPLDWIKKVSPYFFIFCIFLLIAVLIPGLSSEVYGARRWLSIGGIVIQPSEFAKLATAIYFPSWLIKHQRPKSFIAVLGLLIGLLMLEPDLGTTIVITGIAFSLYFISGVEIKKIIGLVAIGLFAGLLLIVASPYRYSRLKTFLDPASDPLGASYHVRQIILGLGSGGLTGTGIGWSRQKYQYLPEATTDSIFVVIAEEMGFLGASLLVIAYLSLILRGVNRIAKLEASYAQMVALSVIAWLSFQTLLNLASMVILVPLTGLPLPFISYGGSSLITGLAGVGLYLNATRLPLTSLSPTQPRNLKGKP